MRYEWVLVTDGKLPPNAVGWSGWNDTCGRDAQGMAKRGMEYAVSLGEVVSIQSNGRDSVLVTCVKGDHALCSPTFNVDEFLHRYVLVEKPINPGCPCGICQGTV